MKSSIIGLTGGIASGKSTVATYLETHYHLQILDADQYARTAVNLGSPILAKIVERWGASILLPDGSLNRSRLGEIIFQNLDDRQWLEAQIHPFVQQCFQEDLDKLKKLKNPPRKIVYVVPLLLETEAVHWVDEVWVVWCTPEQQLQRLMSRDRLHQAAAQARINAQLPLTQKCQQANLILDNSGIPEIWQTQLQNKFKLD
jgi:dephospho-CoA kinase